MAYTVINFKTKKALKEAVSAYNEKNEEYKKHSTIHCYNPCLGPDLSNFTGKVCLEGPHYPAAHTWYSEVELVNDIVVKVK